MQHLSVKKYFWNPCIHLILKYLHFQQGQVLSSHNCCNWKCSKITIILILNLRKHSSRLLRIPIRRSIVSTSRSCATCPDSSPICCSPMLSAGMYDFFFQNIPLKNLTFESVLSLQIAQRNLIWKKMCSNCNFSQYFHFHQIMGPVKLKKTSLKSVSNNIKLYYQSSR